MSCKSVYCQFLFQLVLIKWKNILRKFKNGLMNILWLQSIKLLLEISCLIRNSLQFKIKISKIFVNNSLKVVLFVNSKNIIKILKNIPQVPLCLLLVVIFIFSSKKKSSLHMQNNSPFQKCWIKFKMIFQKFIKMFSICNNPLFNKKILQLKNYFLMKFVWNIKLLSVDFFKINYFGWWFQIPLLLIRKKSPLMQERKKPFLFIMIET